MAVATSDGILPELQREIDGFMATHAAALASSLSEAPLVRRCDDLNEPLTRLRWMATTISKTRFCETIQFLLLWLAALEGRRVAATSVASSKCASWLVAHLIDEILEQRQPSQTERGQRNTSTTAYEPAINRHIPMAPVAAIEKMLDQVLDRCVVVFQETFQSDAARAVENSGGFFAFKPVVLSHLRMPTPESTLLESVADEWRQLLARVSLCSLNPVRLRLQKQLMQDLLLVKNATTTAKDYLLLRNVMQLRLGLTVTTFLWPTSFPQKVKDAALFLKMLQPLALKPFKPATRLAAISSIASMLKHELDALDMKDLHRVHGSVHGVGEWNSCISELHSAALKLCSKREFAIAAWELRVAVLSISPNEIFGRYWKEDVHALLRAQYQQNKDAGGAGASAATVLECVGRCFTHMLKRHFLTERRVPCELDCMEIINTTQAWCFFTYPKQQRSLQRLKDHVIPVLVKISVGIAAYNMVYAIQSHLRRLLLEADHIFDERKLVGLEALLAVLEICYHEGGAANADGLPLDRKILLTNRVPLGELVGQTLIEANAHFGGDLLIESTTAHAAGSGGGISTPAISSATSSAVSKMLRDEYRRSLAIESYACALISLQYLYVALELSDDQKMLILARSCIHNEPIVRESASKTLHYILRHESGQASVVFRSLTDYVFRLSNHLTKPRDFDAFLVLIHLVTSLLRLITVDAAQDQRQRSQSDSLVSHWQSRKAKQESLLQIEAISVYLLVFEDPRLLEASVLALDVVARARQTTFEGDEMVAATVERPSVVDVLRDAEWELRELLFSFESPEVLASLALKDLGFIHQLIADLPVHPRASFRWASCLSVVFARLALWNPEVAAFMWADVNDKVTKLEPAVALFDSEPVESSGGRSSSSGTGGSTGFDLARWRNLAILATSTACPHLVFQPTRSDGEEADTDEQSKNCSVQSVISSSAVQSLFKRLGRYLKSPSVDQMKAAILALGSTHLSSLPILLEVLQRHEAEAFASLAAVGTPANSRHASLGAIPPQVIASSAEAAFSASANGGGNHYLPKLTKEQKARNQKAAAQLQLQWALGRCYCLLLRATQQRPLLSDDMTHEAVHRLQVGATSLLEKTATALSTMHHQHHHNRHDRGSTVNGAPQHLLFMMQQDFCSSVRSLAMLIRDGQSSSSYSSSVRRRQDGSMQSQSARGTRRSTMAWASASYERDASMRSESSSDNAAVFDVKQREAWYHLLLSWCHGFSSLANTRLSANLSGTFFVLQSPARDRWLQRCDVIGERVDNDTVVPWQWMDGGDATRALGIEEAAMASFQRFFLCQTAFATLPVIAQGPFFLPTPITQDSAMFRWMDECFAVETMTTAAASEDSAACAQFQILQSFCHHVLGAFLRTNFRAFAEICVDKSFFSVTRGDKHNVAKHYFRALCSVASELKCELQKGASGASAAPTAVPVVVANGRQPRPSIPTPTNFQVRVCHSILLHLGLDNDEAQRERAVEMINVLYQGDDEEDGYDETMDSGGFRNSRFRLNAMVSSAKRSSTGFIAQVTNRMQVAAASYLVAKLQGLAYPMSMSILTFLSCCEPMQQRKMLTVALPWLADVSLVPKPAVGNNKDGSLASGKAYDTDQLLSLLFRITTNLNAACHDQLEQAWLTLAFANTSGSVDEEAPQEPETNLSKVLQFLFLQRSTPVRLSTAKVVMWWLCRWQGAAHEVLREALLLVETRRRQSAESTRAPTTGAPPMPSTTPQPSPSAIIQPVDDVFVFVILLSDSCCHLSTIPSYLYHHPAMRETMIVQAVHYAFLALFALALDPKAFAVHRFVASSSGGAAVSDHQQQSLYADASNDCLVLLRNLLSQLCAPMELLEPTVDELARWSHSWVRTPDSTQKAGAGRAVGLKSTEQFERAMASFASYLSSSVRNAWALECMKEITLALVPGSTMLAPTSSRCNNVQVLHCVRFGLLGYRVLAPEFHGDVFLSLLDLLHHALEEQPNDQANANAVIRDTLDALRSMVACMPVQRLALYPQVLWVCVALLHQGKSEYSAFHLEATQLLVEVLRMPHFATNQLLQSVLVCKKPARWSDHQASVLRTIVWNLDRGCGKTQQLTLYVVVHLLVLPSPVFHSNSAEHLIISTMTLMPFLTASMMATNKGQQRPFLSRESNNKDDQTEAGDVVKWDEDLGQLRTDLQYAWLAMGSTAVSDVFAIPRDCQHADDGLLVKEEPEVGRTFTQRFASALLPELLELAGDQVSSMITMCFEILVKILAADDIRKREQHGQHVGNDRRQVGVRQSSDGEVVTATLWLVESLMHELEQRKLLWRPTSMLLGSLARLVRDPEQSETWQAAIRIMNCLGSSGRSTSATNAIPIPTLTPSIKSKPQLTVSTAVPPTTNKETAPMSGIDSLVGRNASSTSGASTPSKKERTSSGARLFMGLLGHRSSPSSSSASPSHNQGSNNHTPTSRAAAATPLEDTSRKKSSWGQDPSEERSASPLASRRDL